MLKQKQLKLSRVFLGAIVASTACTLVDWKFRPSLTLLDVAEHIAILAVLFSIVLYLSTWVRLRRDSQSQVKL